MLLVSLDDHIDLAGAQGRMFAMLRILFAEHERELIGERTSDALQHRRRTGQAYSREPNGWAHAADETLHPVPQEQATLAEIRCMHDDGLSDNGIATALNAAGTATKRGGHWTATTVYRILRSSTVAASGSTA